MWQVIAERVRGQTRWPTKFDAAFDDARKKVEAGTHIMCSRYVERRNPKTWEVENFEQRVLKKCRKQQEAFHYWTAPDREEWLKTESRRQSREKVLQREGSRTNG